MCVPHAQDAEARELLHNEIRVVRTLAHPGIVQEYGVEAVEGRLFTVMELVEGTPLNALLAERGPLPFEQALDIVRQAGEALDYAHAGLAIHRDIKPANLVLKAVEDGVIVDSQSFLEWLEVEPTHTAKG